MSARLKTLERKGLSLERAIVLEGKKAKELEEKRAFNERVQKGIEDRRETRRKTLDEKRGLPSYAQSSSALSSNAPSSSALSSNAPSGFASSVPTGTRKLKLRNPFNERITQIMLRNAFRKHLFKTELRINTVDEFKQLIMTKARSLNVNLEYAGSLIMAELLTIKTKNIFKIGAKRGKLISYFKSEDFKQRFMTNIIDRTSGITVSESSYTKYFDMLFNFSVKTDDDDWRSILSPLDNQSQCIRALNIPPKGTNIAVYQDSGQAPNCYFCETKIKPDRSGQQRMECEHLLPILTALRLWDLMHRIEKGDELDKADTEFFAMIYAWSHRCCNQIKSNYDIVAYSSVSKKYIVHVDVIQNILTEIDNPRNPKYDCAKIDKITDVNTTTTNLTKRFQKITDIINDSLEREFGNNNVLFFLFQKYKVISAISSKNFNKILNSVNTDPKSYTKSGGGKNDEEIDEKINKEFAENFADLFFNDDINILNPTIKEVEELFDAIFVNKTYNISSYKNSQIVEEEEDEVSPTNIAFEDISKTSSIIPALSEYGSSKQESKPKSYGVFSFLPSPIQKTIEKLGQLRHLIRGGRKTKHRISKRAGRRTRRQKI